MKSSILTSLMISAVLSVLPAVAPAATVTSGTFTMDLNRDALAQMVANPTGTPPDTLS